MMSGTRRYTCLWARYHEAPREGGQKMDNSEQRKAGATPWRGRMIAPHEASYPDPIAFRSGERLEVSGREDAWGGRPEWVWTWCSDPRGKSGWVPKGYVAVEGDGESGRALRDYNSAELSVAEGDAVVVEGEEESGWFWCRAEATGERGWVPAANVERA